ncbi:unnamed protein product [Rhizoctonia solani]|uniref:Uncharacterized protein n=1 Tax=Rhizoctonia solani TaxID=456999 RepID=A0A8H3CSC0_9AGAM|nr:unnamed protein product [Rhizoctonia solani]
MQSTQAPNTDPLPSAGSCCNRTTRKPTRWNPYGTRSAPPVTRRDSFPLRSSPAPAYTLPLSPELTPESGPTSGKQSQPVTVEDVPEDSTRGEKQESDGHEKANGAGSNTHSDKKYERTDDFIDVMLGILSLIYCSPLLIAGGRTFVIPQNFASHPPPTQIHDSASTAAIGDHKPNHMRWFIERLLERTRPPRAVCQLAVAYLLSASDVVQNELRTAAEARLRRAAAHHHPPLALPHLSAPMTMMTPGSVMPPSPENQLPPPYSAEPAMPVFSIPIGMPPIHAHLPLSTHTNIHLPLPVAPVSALLDPRRVLLAVMVLAHKFHLDKTWTNKAWAKVSGLEPLMSYLAAFGRHASSLIGAMLLTSFAFQNILHRRISSAEQDRLTAHKSILESLVKRLKEGEDMSEAEVVRLIRLARGGGEEGGGIGIADTPWNEVVFGKRIKESKAVEGKALEEWNTAVARAEEPATPEPPAAPPVGPTPTPPIHASAQAQKKPTFL